MSFSPYVIARQAIYWKFPSATERIAYVATKVEVTKIAWQLSDDTLWMLKAAPGTWVEIGTGSGGGGSGMPSNLVSAPTTVLADTSLVLASYLRISDTLHVSGNVRITG